MSSLLRKVLCLPLLLLCTQAYCEPTSDLQDNAKDIHYTVTLTKDKWRASANDVILVCFGNESHYRTYGGAKKCRRPADGLASAFLGTMQNATELKLNDYLAYKSGHQPTVREVIQSPDNSLRVIYLRGKAINTDQITLQLQAQTVKPNKNDQTLDKLWERNKEFIYFIGAILLPLCSYKIWRSVRGAGTSTSNAMVSRARQQSLVSRSGVRSGSTSPVRRPINRNNAGGNYSVATNSRVHRPNNDDNLLTGVIIGSVLGGGDSSGGCSGGYSGGGSVGGSSGYSGGGDGGCGD